MVNHVVYVHQTVGVFSKTFLQKLRRVNYTTPKNYLDFINTYNKLLEEKDKFVLEQVSVSCIRLGAPDLGSIFCIWLERYSVVSIIRFHDFCNASCFFMLL